MSDNKNKTSKLAKELVKISQEERRQLQYLALKKWDAGHLTGLETIEEILDLEKIIKIDINKIREARNGKIPRQKK